MNFNFQADYKFDFKINTSTSITSSVNTSSSTVSGVSTSNKNDQIESELQKIKFEYNNQIQIIQNETSVAMNERNQKREEMRKLQEESSRLKLQKDKLELTIQELLQKKNRLVADEEQKKAKQDEIESNIRSVQDKLSLNLEQDLQWEFQIKRQQEIIIHLQTDLETFRIESHNYESTIKNLEAQLNLMNNQLYQLKKNYNDLLSKMQEIQSEKSDADERLNQEQNKVEDIKKETENLNEALNLKNSIITDSFTKLNTLNTRLEEANRKNEENVASIKVHERRYNELVNLKSQLEFKININKNENESKTIKIKSLETIISLKDQKIEELNNLIKIYDSKIDEMRIIIEKGNSEMNNLKNQIEAKIKLIQDFERGNAMDDDKIQELTNLVEMQKESIKSWEEENKRDDDRIAYLESQLDKTNLKIIDLRLLIVELRSQFASIYESVEIFSIEDTSAVERIVQGELTYEKVKRYKEIVKYKDETLNNIKKNIESMNGIIVQLNNENNQLESDLDRIKIEYKNQISKKESERKNFKKKLESIAFTNKTNQMEALSVRVATIKVQSYIENFSQKIEDTNSIFDDLESLIDTALSS